MEDLLMLIVVAILIESVWETLKMVWQEKKLSLDKVGALIVSLLITFGTRLDILNLLDIKSSIPYLGIILTGILLSRGSNFIHDLINKLQGTKKEG